MSDDTSKAFIDRTDIEFTTVHIHSAGSRHYIRINGFELPQGTKASIHQVPGYPARVTIEVDAILVCTADPRELPQKEEPTK